MKKLIFTLLFCLIAFPVFATDYGTVIGGRFFTVHYGEWYSGLYRSNLRDLFSITTVQNAGKFLELQPERGNYQWWPLDAMLNWCEENNIRLKHHVLLWDKDMYFPQWYKDLSPAERYDALEEHIRAVASRYRGRFYAYDVVNEAVWNGDPNDYMNTGRHRLDLISSAFEWIREEDPNVLLLMNEKGLLRDDPDRPWAQWGCEEYRRLIQDLLNRNTPIDAIGIQGHLADALPPPGSIETKLQMFSSIGLPIHITEFDMQPPPDPDLPYGSYPNWWEYQKYAYPEAYELFAQYAEAITMWGFWDGAIWRPGAGLFREDWTPKPVYCPIRRIVK